MKRFLQTRQLVLLTLIVGFTSANLAAKPGGEQQEPKDAKPEPPKAKGRTLDDLLGSFLFFPSKFPVGNYKPEKLTFEDAWFNADDGTRLHGWYCPAKNPRAIVLYAHGNAGNLSHRAGLMQYYQDKLQMSTLIFDYRGYGRSEGKASVAGILQDARAARKWLAKRAAVKEGQIVLIGQSLGGAVTVDLAADGGARGLVLESTFSSLKDMANHHYAALAWLVPADKLNSAARLRAYKGPLLQVHGDADRTIPFAQGTKLFQAATGTKEFIRVIGGDHNDTPAPGYLEKLDRFIGGLPQ